jgi:hypothetical protein
MLACHQYPVVLPMLPRVPPDSKTRAYSLTDPVSPPPNCAPPSRCGTTGPWRNCKHCWIHVIALIAGEASRSANSALSATPDGADAVEPAAPAALDVQPQQTGPELPLARPLTAVPASVAVEDYQPWSAVRPLPSMPNTRPREQPSLLVSRCHRRDASSCTCP